MAANDASVFYVTRLHAFLVSSAPSVPVSMCVQAPQGGLMCLLDNQLLKVLISSVNVSVQLLGCDLLYVKEEILLFNFKAVWRESSARSWALFTV